MYASYTNVDTFVKDLNLLRRKSTYEWYIWTGYVQGLYVEIKAYDTWLQIFKVDGVNHSTPSAKRTVKDFRQHILRAVGSF